MDITFIENYTHHQNLEVQYIHLCMTHAITNTFLPTIDNNHSKVQCHVVLYLLWFCFGTIFKDNIIIPPEQHRRDIGNKWEWVG